MRIALAAIRQRPLDITGNLDKVKRCVAEAIHQKADIWIGADYELLGYWAEPLDIDEMVMEQVEEALGDLCKTLVDASITVYVRAPHELVMNATYCIQRGKMLLVPDCLIGGCMVDQSPKSVKSVSDAQACISTSILGTDGMSTVFSGQIEVRRFGRVVCGGESYSLKDYNMVIYTPENQTAAIFDENGSEKIKIITSWMYDKLMGSKQSGFFVPLSGGIDSALSALLVKKLQMRMKMELELDYPMTSILHTAYLKGEHSSIASQDLANRLSLYLNSTHYEYDICGIIQAFPKSPSKPALQNATARLRLVLAYYIAQSSGKYLVVGTGNRDEIMTGYFTKYDCSSGDIAPIADLSKLEIRQLVYELLGSSVLAQELVAQRSTAELSEGQYDEDDLGMTYEEMSVYFEQLYDSRCTCAKYVNRFRQNYHKIKTLPVHCQCSQRSFADLFKRSSRGPL